MSCRLTVWSHTAMPALPAAGSPSMVPVARMVTPENSLSSLKLK